MREKLARIDAVQALAGQRLRVTFSDGWQVELDLTRFIASFASLAPLQEPERFQHVALEEWGSGLTWDDEGPLSIAATTLYRLAAEQSGDDARYFDAWMICNGLSASQAAESLGMTRRSIIHYRTGSRPLPRYIRLACKGWEAERANRQAA